MGGFFGVSSKKECITDLFFGIDYHSHLGTYRAGLIMLDGEIGFQREIHNIQSNSFKSKFADVFDNMKGTSGLACISDDSPAPLLISSHLGTYAICTLGLISNAGDIYEYKLRQKGVHFEALSRNRINPTEIVASLINEKDSFKEGILYAQSLIAGSCNIVILTADGSLIAARDRIGRIPVNIGFNKDGHCVSFESFAMYKTDYEFLRSLGPQEIVKINTDGIEVLSQAREEMKICSFLWNYFGYPTSTYEGVNVEIMRNRNGRILAKEELDKSLFDQIDYVCGVPDSGVPHAIGYAAESGVQFARCFIKYTPSWSRSFMPQQQEIRNRTAKMKQIPVREMIEGKNLLFVDDSIVRGTQLRETVEFLKASGAKNLHMRSACPPMMYPCKFLNFNAPIPEMGLITRKTIVELEGEEGLKHIDEYSDKTSQRGRKLREMIAEKLNFNSVDFQSISGIVEAIGLDPDKLCTYCWNGKE